MNDPSNLFPSSLSASSSFPSHPSAALQREEDRNAAGEAEKWWMDSTMLNICIFESMHFTKCWIKLSRHQDKIKVRCECASTLWWYLDDFLSPAALTRFSDRCFQQPHPSKPECSNQARGILPDLWG